ncbi:MAG: hypothetical protein ABR497_03675 [Kiritimatiellia bacterium]
MLKSIASGLIAGCLALGCWAADDEFADQDAVWQELDNVVPDDRETACPAAQAAGKAAVEIGRRLELFVDEFLVDDLTGGAIRRLHHPVPREIVMHFGDQGMPWDQAIAHPTVVRDGERILLYYRASFPKKNSGKKNVACVIESSDGINFTRPVLGLHDISGMLPSVSNNNNIIWMSGPINHFTPFLDTNPDASPDERFKAVARHPAGRMVPGALTAFASSDGLEWRMLYPEKAFGTHPSDSQNLAFWDSARRHYVCYMRGRPEHRGGVRDVRYLTSPDFRDWTDPEFLEYTDERHDNLYTNGIHPYEGAPHILIGFPNRIVQHRIKVPGEPAGVNDVILMSSRDGVLFERWNEGFIRPGPGDENWTNRSYYPTANTVQTSHEELSLYWTEHNHLPTMRLRRGTLRVDGFVSINAGEQAGEMLTRPLIFSRRLSEV